MALNDAVAPHLDNNATDVVSAAETLSEAAASESFLRFYLDSNLPVLLSVQQMTEVLTLSFNQVVPMFEMPAWVMGVNNWRGEVLWIVDLNHFLGLTPWYQQADYGSKHTVIVLRSSLPANDSASQEVVLGLVVNQVEDMVICNSQSIQPPSDWLVAPEIQPFLRGCWQDAPDRLNWVLEGAAIINTMPTLDD